MDAATRFQATGDRIATLVEQLQAIADPQLRAKAEELVRSLMELYGGGLERLLEIVDEERAAGAASARTVERLFARFGEDLVVSTVLLLHGLHPLDTATRVERALDGVRPFLASHGGGVTLLGVEGAAVRLRLEGSCNGCPSSSATMKLAVEQAIAEAAPEVLRVAVEGAVALPGREAPGECTASAGGGALRADERLVQLGR